MLDHYLTELVQWIELQPVWLIYITFTIIAYMENILPPIPGDMLVAFAGYLVAESILNPYAILSLTVVSSVIGFITMYYLGWTFGWDINEKSRTSRWLSWINPLYINKALFWMDRYGLAIILLNRFLAGTRSVIAIAAGISKLKVSSTILASTISSLFWNSILIYGGFIVQSNWRIIGIYVSRYGTVILAIMVILIAYKLIKRYNNSQKD